MTALLKTALCVTIAAATLSLSMAPTTVDAKSFKAGMKRGGVAVHQGAQSKSLTTGFKTVPSPAGGSSGNGSSGGFRWWYDYSGGK